MQSVKNFLKTVFSRAVLSSAVIALFFCLFLRFLNTSISLLEIKWIIIPICIISALVVLGFGKSSASKILFLLLIIAFPLAGSVIALFLCLSPKRQEQKSERTDIFQRNQNLAILQKENYSVYKQAVFFQNVFGFSVFAGNFTSSCEFGEEAFEQILNAINSAQKYIFIEFFIFSQGIMLDRLVAALSKKAADGIDVRMIYDDCGSIFTVPYNFPQKLKKLGISCRVYGRFRPKPSAKVNHRDHRKIIVADGKIAFTGGFNIADEYIHAKQLHGYWKDEMLTVKGEAAFAFTVMFLEMWNGGKPCDYSAFRPESINVDEAKGFVLPFDCKPNTAESISLRVYLNMINTACNYIYIQTPYLIPNEKFTEALCLAAQSGVDVRIITPGMADKALIFQTTRAYYPQLIRAGVKIFEYSPGFLHSKVILSDGICAVAGSINTDYRSFYHHFENAVWNYKTQAVEDIAKDFENTFPLCRQITEKDTLRAAWYKKLLWFVLRIFSSIM